MPNFGDKYQFLVQQRSNLRKDKFALCYCYLGARLRVQIRVFLTLGFVEKLEKMFGCISGNLVPIFGRILYSNVKMIADLEVRM